MSKKIKDALEKMKENVRTNKDAIFCELERFSMNDKNRRLAKVAVAELYACITQQILFLENVLEDE